MPVPSDEKLLALSESILQQFEKLFGQHPGFRPAHAKGVLLSGKFEPTSGAATLTTAPHFNRASTPVTVRFSDSSGLPLIPDTDPNANPKGIAVRFHLGERVHTDIIGHSTDGFPTRTGGEFLEFLQALASSDLSDIPASPLGAFLGSHPAALRFVQTPKPPPVSFATEAYFGVTAMRFVDQSANATFGRFRLVPAAGLEHLDEVAAAKQGPTYLFDEIAGRIGKEPVVFQLRAQLAGAGDTVDDATIHWPEERTVIELGTITLAEPVAENAHEQKHIIFDPIPRVEGIEPSDDPLLELRAALYLISGRRRRAAAEG